MSENKKKPYWTKAMGLEFLKDPHGRHSPDLQSLLRTFRGARDMDLNTDQSSRFALYRSKPNREWTIIELIVKPDGQVEVKHTDLKFNNILDAERGVFLLQWKRFFGSELV
jgi:hypothetical protein